MDTILDVKNIIKDFAQPLSFSALYNFKYKNPPPTRALSDISFTLERGRILAVLGPNGAGKTTLLKMLSTLILPDRGSVTINGFSLGQDDEKIKSMIGFVSGNERSFYWRLTGRQNLEFFAAMHGLSKSQTKKKIGELCNFFGITYADRRFDSYSSGMKQRIGIIRSLIHDPELLLLDEPTKSLDYTSSREVADFLKDTLVGAHGKTILLSTHSIEEAAHIADFLMIIREGKAIWLGTLEELYKTAGRSGLPLEAIYSGLTKDGCHA